MAGWVRVGDLHLCANPGGVGPSRAFVGPQKYEKWFEQRIPVSRKNFFRLTGIPVLWKIVFCALRIPVSRKKFFRLTGLPAPPEICNHPPPAHRARGGGGHWPREASAYNRDHCYLYS